MKIARPEASDEEINQIIKDPERARLIILASI